ncbi:ester cyclase [Neobacillus sp. SCS-31]|uniref:ester cyclase n=1 Tax=Neobacillus oceani TaxID=3115292 RepID=UPI003905EC69
MRRLITDCCLFLKWPPIFHKMYFRAYIIKGSGNNSASLMGLPPTNKYAEIQGISLFELEQGKIKMNRVVFNTLDMFQQLGVYPSEL